LYSENYIHSMGKNDLIWLVEGQANDAELKTATVVPQNTLTGHVNTYFPGLIRKNGNSLVFYTYQSSTKNVIPNIAIYMQDLTLAAGNPILLFNFATYSSNAPSINNISVCKDDIYPDQPEFQIAFDCGGKIFTLKVMYESYRALAFNLCMVYGNLNTGVNTADQNFINDLKQMIAKKTLQILPMTSRDGTTSFYNENLETSQKIGFVDCDGFFLSIQFIANNTVQEILFDKHYSLPANIRTVGSIT